MPGYASAIVDSSAEDCYRAAVVYTQAQCAHLKGLPLKNITLIAALSLLITSAMAQVRPMGFEAGVNAGVWEGDAVYESGAMFGGQLRFNLTHLFGVEASFHSVLSRALEREQAAVAESRDATLGLFGLDGVLHLRDGRFVPFIVAGLAAISDDENYLGSNAGAGAVYYINDWLGARIDVRGWFSGDAPSTDRFHHIGATAGLFVRFMGDDDRDDDGIKDVDDQCVWEAEDKDEFEDSDGCPDTDNDKDKVLDVDDKCPLEPEDMDGDADEDGCPEEDKAPEKPAVVDSDKDGIPDDKDRCPMQAESVNGVEDEDGCPERKVIITRDKIVIGEKIYFELDKAVIKEESYGLLTAVAEVLKANAFIQEVEVHGHTDAQGTDEYNQKLSDERAKAVKTFLSETGGIEASRLVAKGFGKSKPMAEGDTDEAHAQNRRVEFIITKQAEQKPAVKYVPVAPKSDADAVPEKAEPQGDDAKRSETDKAEPKKADADKAEPKKADADASAGDDTESSK
ncbi:MAG: OmpA family protein [Bradymonadia bacterium]